MASETISLRTRVQGARKAAAELAVLAAATAGLDDSQASVDKRTRAMTRSSKIFSGVMTVATSRVVLYGAAFIGLSYAAYLASAAVLAAAGVMVAAMAAILPIVALVIGSVMYFKDTVNQAGSAANTLKDTFKGFGATFKKALSPAAEKILNAITDALITLAPLVMHLQGAFTRLGSAVADGIRVFADGISGMGPALSDLLDAMKPMIQQGALFAVAFTKMMTAVGTASMPLLTQVLKWLTDFMNWMSKASTIKAAGDFISTAMQRLASTARFLWAAGKELWSILKDLGSIIIQLAPLWKILGGMVMFFLRIIRKMIGFVEKHMDVFGPIITGITLLGVAIMAWGPVLMMLRAFYIAWQLIVTVFYLVKAAWILLNIAFLTSPIGWIIVGVIALGVAIYELWKHSETFRNGVKLLWDLLKNSPLGLLVRFIYNNAGPAFKWLADKAAWLLRQLQPLIDAYKWIKDQFTSDHSKNPLKHTTGMPTPTPAAKGTPGAPPVTPTPYSRPQQPHKQSGAAHTSTSPKAHASAAGDIVVPVTVMAANGRVLAEETARARRKAMALA